MFTWAFMASRHSGCSISCCPDRLSGALVPFWWLVGRNVGSTWSVVLFVHLLYSWAFVDFRCSWCVIPGCLFACVVSFWPFGGACEQSSGKRGRWCCFFGAVLLGVPGVSLLLLLPSLRPYGGGCEHASGKRGSLFWFCWCCIRGRSWRLVTRRASSLAVLLVCTMVL